MSLIEQFHDDHQKVVSALFELRRAITERDVPRVRKILGAAEDLVGPHFKFEELYLYPALEPFLGEAYGKRLLNEHDGIFRSVRKIAQLAQSDAWNDAQYESAMANLELIYEHPHQLRRAQSLDRAVAGRPKRRFAPEDARHP